MAGRTEFPLGRAVTREELERDPHPALAALREQEPVSWIDVLDGWLVTRYDLALAVMRDPVTFTVDDERFSTAQVLGPSMLSLDGPVHARHRTPFVAPFRPDAVRERFAAATRAECDRLLTELAPRGGCELRGEFAGPLAAGVLTRALGLTTEETDAVRAWYEAIVGAVTAITAGASLPEAGVRAYAALADRLSGVLERPGGESLLGEAAASAGATLGRRELVANAAVLLFGGIETTEAMIANAVLLLLEAPDVLARARRGEAEGLGAATVDAATLDSAPLDSAAIEAAALDSAVLDGVLEESLRLEPAASVVDRYATADVELGGARIRAGDLVRVSLAAAGRDPAVFADPDRLDVDRERPRRHLAFAQGPHVCLGVHLARLEARTALAALLVRLPGLALDPARPAAARGLVFRKPPELWVQWTIGGNATARTR